MINVILIMAVFLVACSSTAPGLFGKKSPHDQYGQRISDAGLRETALGRLWFKAAEDGLAMPLSVSLPYVETGYFAAERPEAVGLSFPAKRGEKLRIILDKKPALGFSIYLDLWEPVGNSNTKTKLLLAADTISNILEYDVKNDAIFLLRLQPELLKSGEYTLSITTLPSLAFPIPAEAKSYVGSLWGVGRDRGARKHEGIDIFAAFHTPAIAAADGTVTSVSENELGGKVVFLRPKNKDFALYYAHLDAQLVHEGQFIKTGDTVGLVGNTGNARTTAPHLHFGIYTSSGAVDPLPFVNQPNVVPAKITAPLIQLGKVVRSNNKGTKLFTQPDIKMNTSMSLENHTPLLVQAATGGLYIVSLPDGKKGFINSASVEPLNNPVRRSKTISTIPMLDEPDSIAPRKMILSTGEPVNILGAYDDYYYINKENERGWIVKKAIN